MCLDGETGEIEDRVFGDLEGLLAPGDLLVLNDTRVIPARLFGRKETGGRVELLIERLLSPERALAHIRASKAPRAGSRVRVGPQAELRVEARRAIYGARETP